MSDNNNNNNNNNNKESDLKEIANHLSNINKKLENKKEKGLAKTDYVFILILALGLIFITIWQMGTFSSNIKQENTQEEILNIMINNFTKYIDRQNNTTHQILKGLTNSTDQNSQILTYLNKSQNNQRLMLDQLHKGLEQNQNITAQNYQISQEHKQVARDHDIIQNDTAKITDHVDTELTRYGENSINQLNKIIENQNKILELLTITTSKNTTK